MKQRNNTRTLARIEYNKNDGDWALSAVYHLLLDYPLDEAIALVRGYDNDFYSEIEYYLNQIKQES